MDSATYYAELLSDTRKLAAIAFRKGKLPADSRVFELIDEVTAKVERGEHVELAPLLGEIARVSKAAGVTMQQLVRRESHLNHWRRGAVLATPFVVGFLTLLLTLYLAFQSFELHKADQALREYSELIGERPPEKVHRAWRMYRFERALEVKGRSMAETEHFQSLIDDAQRLYRKRSAVQDLLREASLVRAVPQFFESHGPCFARKFFARVNAGTSVVVPLADCLAPLSEPEAAAATDLPKAPEFDPSKCAPTPAPPEKTAVADRAGGLRGSPVVLAIDVADYSQEMACFFHAMGIENADYPADPEIFASRNKVHLLVSWLLPGLYGLLGACVFVMRDLLRQNGSRSLGVEPRIVELLALLLRVALGGLAGIIIGWFSVPTAIGVQTSGVNVSSVPFGIAFLAGYGIEGLFALLDRMVKSVGRPTNRRSTDAPKGPE